MESRCTRGAALLFRYGIIELKFQINQFPLRSGGAVNADGADDGEGEIHIAEEVYEGEAKGNGRECRAKRE